MHHGQYWYDADSKLWNHLWSPTDKWHWGLSLWYGIKGNWQWGGGKAEIRAPRDSNQIALLSLYRWGHWSSGIVPSIVPKEWAEATFSSVGKCVIMNQWCQPWMYGRIWGPMGGHGGIGRAWDVGEGGERAFSIMPLGSHQWPILSQCWMEPWSQEGTEPGPAWGMRKPTMREPSVRCNRWQWALLWALDSSERTQWAHLT